MTDNNQPASPLGNVYTLNEAAAKLRVSRRALQVIIVRLPFYSKNGKVYLFSDADILKIWEGMREESNERLNLLGIPRDLAEWSDEQLKNATWRNGKIRLRRK